MAKKKIKFNYFRLIIQWSILLMLGYMVVRLFTDSGYVADFEAYCPFGGIQSLGSYFVNGTLACSMTTTQIVMGIALIVAVLLFSKLFCGYICPLGTVSEWLGKIGKKLKISINFTGIADRLLRVVKYALLFITVYFTLSSSELFCKEYDPFYAIFTWFGHDVTLIYAIITILVLIAGSIFFKQFWCRYACPLAALSNIFTFIVPFAAITAVYVILIVSGVSIDWFWYLLTITVAAYLTEAFRLKARFIPFLRITRNDDICTSCKLCDKACPQGITVSQGDVKVKQIDCNLCADCVTVCPHEGALGINKTKMKWLPALITVLLVSVAFYFTLNWELPTVNEKWGTEEQMQKAEVFEMDGLKNIKCFGSSMGFLAQMREVEGVLGAATFVKHHAVKVYYDPTVIDSEALVKAIFNPIRSMIEQDGEIPEVVSYIDFGIEKFFDSYDAFYFSKLMESSKGIFAFESYFGEPVHVKIFYDKSVLSPDDLINIVEQKTVEYSAGEETYQEQINFKVHEGKYSEGEVLGKDLQRDMFNGYEESFPEHGSIDSVETNKVKLKLLNGTESGLSRWYPYLGSHLFEQNSILFMKISYEDFPVGEFWIRKDKAEELNLIDIVNSDSLFVTYNDGSKGAVVNPFRFDNVILVHDSVAVSDTIAIQDTVTMIN